MNSSNPRLVSLIAFRFAARVAAILLLVLTAGLQLACASVYRDTAIYDGTRIQEVSLDVALAGVRPGTVLFVSENHGIKAHHQRQVQVLDRLRDLGFKVSVGLEFFPYTEQAVVDSFVAGEIEETDFLTKLGWKGDFSDYRRQALFARETGGKTLALNAPRSLTGAISKGGLESLSAEQRALLPPDFMLGNDSYFARFKEVMQEHVKDEALDRYFAAQSVWDDTMAWILDRHLGAHPNDVVVVIVGDFHVAYGGGLPDRLRACGRTDLVTLSQVHLDGLSDREEIEVVQPHPKWGARGDFIWVAY